MYLWIINVLPRLPLLFYQWIAMLGATIVEFIIVKLSAVEFNSNASNWNSALPQVTVANVATHTPRIFKANPTFAYNMEQSGKW